MRTDGALRIPEQASEPVSEVAIPPAPPMLVLNEAQAAAVEAIKGYLTSPPAWLDGSPAHYSGGGPEALLDEQESTSPPKVKPFILAGLAGTGKTTLVKKVLDFLTSEQGIPSGRIALLAPTGKATAVLNSKQQVVTARTIHSFLYGRPNDLIDTITKKCDKLEADFAAARDAGDTENADLLRSELLVVRESLKEACKKTNTLSFTKKANDDLTEDTDVILVDEASMVGTQIANDLLTIGLPVVFIGDGNQLPPVNDTFGVPLTAPTKKLTQIVRQAADSGVLGLSRHVLVHGGLPKTAAGFPDVEFSIHSNPLRFIEPAAREPYGLPQFICYFNNRRHEINRAVRRHIHGSKLDANFPHHPFIGEQLMIDANVPALRVTRGDIVTVVRYGTLASDPQGESGDEREPIDREKFAHAYLDQEINQQLVVADRYGVEFSIPAFMNDMMISWAHPSAFDPGNRDPKQLRYLRSLAKDRVPVMFPYAITCHKSQGSEYPHVVLFNDKPKTGYKPFLYTGITRASKKLTIAGVW